MLIKFPPALDTECGRVYNIVILKSKEPGVKCQGDGELPPERRDFPAVRVLHPASYGNSCQLRGVVEMLAPLCPPFAILSVEKEGIFMCEKRESVFRTDLAMLGNIRVLVAAAVLSAMSFILGKFLQIPNPLSEIFRISFENLPIILAGVVFGPWVGGMVGAVADLVGCMLYGYPINPIITLGAVAVGIAAGAVSHYFVKRPQWLSLAAATLTAHLAGSVGIKSLGLAAWYLSSYNMGLAELMLWRLLLYFVIGSVEFMLIRLLLGNAAVSRQLQKMKGRAR